MNVAEEIFLDLGKSNWKRPRRGMKPGTPLFYPFLALTLREVSQIGKRE